MSLAPVNPQDLLALLQDEHSAICSFIALLEQEQQILLGTDVDALSQLVDQKNSVIANIARLGQARKPLLVDSPTAADAELALSSVAPAALPLWQETKTLAERARHLNDTNGQLIQTRLRLNQQTLSVLHHASHSAGLYGANGQPNIGSSGRTLGKG